MGTVTIGAVFQALQIARGKQKRARDNKTEDYGKAIVACAVLERIIENCKTEVELSDDVIDVIVPLLSTR